MFEAADNHSVQWRFERGDLDAAAVYEHFCRATGTRPDAAALWTAGADMFDEIPETVALVRRLSAAGHRLGILSNTNSADWDFFGRGRFPVIVEAFEHAVLSFEARAMKPEAAIFTLAVERAGVPAREVFFVDDVPENVAGACAAGLDAVLFTTPAELKAALQHRGVAGLENA